MDEEVILGPEIAKRLKRLQDTKANVMLRSVILSLSM